MNKKKLGIILCLLVSICLLCVLGAYRKYTLKEKENKNNIVYAETQDKEIKEKTKEEKTESTTEVVKEKPKKKKKVKYLTVWTTANLNIREEPTIESKIVGNYPWGTKITVTYVNSKWAKIKKTGKYINRTYLCESPIGYKDYDVPKNNTMKTYMDYRAITSRISKQYKLQKKAYTGEYGIRKVGYRYCVALGSYYTTKIGQYVDIELANGNVIYGILADQKANNDTDSSNRMHPDGSVVEFIVNTDRLNSTAMKMGDLSYVNDWNSKVINIRVYDEVEDF